MAIDPTGGLLVAGLGPSSDGIERMSLLRLDANGNELCRAEAELPDRVEWSAIAVHASGDALAAASLHGDDNGSTSGLSLLSLPR